jgi:hypothetical protein
MVSRNEAVVTRSAPVRSASQPASGDANMVGTVAAMDTSPTLVELYPHTACMCNGSAGSIAVNTTL